jgi:DNA invertase Pin-like site-specific DNA recombinase
MAIIIYTRTSTEKQDLGHDVQIQKCLQWAADNGHQVRGIFSEKISGSVNPFERPIFCDAVSSLEAGDILCVHRRDRLGRDVVNNAVTTKIVKSKGAELHSLDCGSARSHEDMLMQTMLDAFAAYERALIMARIKNVMAERKAQGLICGNVPIGKVANENGMLIDNQEELDKVELVRSWRESGMTLKDIIAKCAEHNILTRAGNVPQYSTLSEWCSGIKVVKQKAPKIRKKREVFRKPVEDEPQNKGLKELILEYKAKGHSNPQVAELIEGAGYRNSKGKPFHHGQIRRIYLRHKDQADVA